jgi:site-specific recombinase XerD
MAVAPARKRTWKYEGLRKTARQGQSYQAYVCHNGQRFRMSCHSAIAAREVESEVFMAMRSGRFRPEYYKKTVEDVVILMLEEMRQDYEDETLPFATLKNVESTCINYVVGDRARYDIDGKRHINDKMVPWSRKQAIGSLKLCEVTPPKVTEFMKRLRKAQANYDLRSRTLSALRKVFDYAIQDLGWALTNPCAGMEERKYKQDMKAGIQVPEKDTINLLRMVANPLQELMLEFTCSTALRVGELMALTWDNVKLDKSKLEIQYTIDKSGIRVRPKSESGMRPIDLADDLVEALASYKSAMEEAMGGELNSDDFVFRARNGRHFTHSSFYDQVVRPLFKAAEAHQKENVGEFELLPANIKWKDFRHFAISCWLELDFPDVVVWTMAGHANFQSIERTYGHMLKSEDRLNKLSELHKQLFSKHMSYEAYGNDQRDAVGAK